MATGCNLSTSSSLLLDSGHETGSSHRSAGLRLLAMVWRLNISRTKLSVTTIFKSLCHPGVSPCHLKAITAEKKATVERHSGLLTGGRQGSAQCLTGSTVVATHCRRHPSSRPNLNQVRDLLNLRSDLTVDVLQRDRVNACQIYLIEGY